METPGPVPGIPAPPAEAVNIDFEDKFPRGMTGKLDRRIKQGTKSLEAVKTGNDDNYEVAAEIPLDDPLTVTASTVITFKYYLLEGSAMEVAITGTDAQDQEITATYFKMVTADKKWQTISLNATDLKIGTTPLAAGAKIKSLRIRAGFKGDEAGTTLNIDDIILTP